MLPRRRWHRAAFVAAGLYNIGWGLYSVLNPALPGIPAAAERAA